MYKATQKQSAALSSATQHAMPPEFGGKRGTECLNARFPQKIQIKALIE